MKRLFPAVLTALLLTACPQAGQVLGPGTFNAGAPKELGPSATEKGDIPAETPPEATPPPDLPPAVPPEANDAASQEKSTSFRVIAGINPIEPKSDTREVTISLFGDARLRYGANFSQVLPQSGSMPLLLNKTTEPQTLNYALDLTFGEFERPDGTIDPGWSPANLPEEGHGQLTVRMVFVPDGPNAGPPVYCDGVWVDLAQNGGANISFPNVAIGPGQFSFHLFVVALLNADFSTSLALPSDFHQGDLIPLTTGDPAHPFPPWQGTAAARIVPLGSFSAFKYMKLTLP